jgi:NAD(P)-dependent dehydrogenase (short-subunit alcohol dehydrogenase family)
MKMSDLFRLDGKVALVLGGAGGIGSALSMGMAENGAKVVVADVLSMDALSKYAEEIKTKTGVETMAHQVDVTSEENMAGLVKDVLARFGAIDILVNAFGLNMKRPALEYPMDDWEKMFAVNVKGVMIACKHVANAMKERKKGSIINLSSVRGIRGFGGGNSAYCGTKGAVEMITKTLAIELAPFNIRVNALGPALIITQGTIHIQQNPALADKYKALIPMGRLGMPEDLVGPAVYLASDAAGFHTGQTLFIDGGATAS